MLDFSVSSTSFPRIDTYDAITVVYNVQFNGR